MSRATLISRVVFGLLVVSTFTAFFVAQRLKRTDPLVYAVNVKRYVSPNGDGLREKGRLRFRTKEDDRVTVEVVDRNGIAVRTLADNRQLRAGAHTLFWNGRFVGRGKTPGNPVPDGAYRVRITMEDSGRTFVPDKFFVVDTQAPQMSAEVTSGHQVSVLAGRRPVRIAYSGIEGTRRVEFLVFRVRGQRSDARPVAAFASTRGERFGVWNQTVGQYRLRKGACFGRLQTKGRPRPAPVGSYVIVVRACDAAGNVGYSSDGLPPRRGSTSGLSGVTLNGVQIAPPRAPSIAGTRASFTVNPPRGGYSWRITPAGGGSAVASGRARGASLRLTVPDDEPNGLYLLRIKARDPVAGDPGVARAPIVISDGRKRDLLIVEPAIAWQATNPVDLTGDGFGDPFPQLPPGRQVRVATDRTLATPSGTTGFALQEGALAGYLAAQPDRPSAQYTTDLALAAADPATALAGHRAVLFAGDERWITPQLGTALRAFVERGGKVAFFAPDAFRRTVRLSANQISGPSERRQRDIFGESIDDTDVAPAPVVPFVDELGLLRGNTGLFTGFEQSRSRARSSEVQTAAGREEGRPALVAYKLGKGLVIRVGVAGWQAELRGSADANVAYTTNAILAELAK